MSTELRVVRETEAGTVPPPTHPMRVAKALVEARYTGERGITLRNYHGDFYQWDGTQYIELHRRDVERVAYGFLDHSYYHKGTTNQLTPFAPTQRKISDVLHALQACVGIESIFDAPHWVDQRSDPAPAHIIALANGMLDIATRTMHPSTPLFFNHHALPFSFNPTAMAAPRWQSFLRQLWPNDEESILCLQEVFGYLLTTDTRQQKAFLMVGPKRAGKGTLGRVLTGLLGPHNVAAPTLASLATNFGMQPLVGRPLALISDARLSGRSDSKVVVERLLSVSGEDSITIDRKYREPWTGRLPTRFMVLSNELPRLSDASGALTSRFIVFMLTNSFYQAENPNLTVELLSESSAIFNWALEGLDRLLTRGYFVNPSSGAEAIQQMEDLASPIRAFVRDRCTIDPPASVGHKELWNSWKEWCADTNNAPSNQSTFGRDLRAIIPTLKNSQVGPRGSRDRCYVGIKIRDTDELELGSADVAVFQ